LRLNSPIASICCKPPASENEPNLSELVRSGKLDFLLLLPVNTRFLVSLRQVDLGAFVNACSAVALMVYAARQLHLVPTLIQVLGFLALCVTGVAIHYCLMFLLARPEAPGSKGTDKPPILLLNMGSACNLRCRYCSVPAQEGKSASWSALSEHLAWGRRLGARNVEEAQTGQ